MFADVGAKNSSGALSAKPSYSKLAVIADHEMR